MVMIYGYGEDALTLWLLKNRPQVILDRFNDKTKVDDCTIFYRPSFGRSGGLDSAEFGEFDAIMASRENIYLIESKWDNHRNSSRTELILRPEQLERHRIFKWYLSNWNNWQAVESIEGKKIAPPNSLLAKNLQQILSQLHLCCLNSDKTDNVRNVLIFFHSSESSPPQKVSEGFTLVSIGYKDKYVNL